MSRLASRLARLETARQETNGGGAYHLAWDEPGLTAEQHLARLIEAGEAKPGDNVIVHAFVRPGPDGPERVYLPKPEGFDRWR